MKKSENTQSVGKSLACSILFGLAVTLLCTICGTLAVYMGWAGEEKIPYLACAGLCIGCFLSAWSAGVNAKEKKPAFALLAGVGVFLCMILLSLIWFGEQAALPKILRNGVLAVVFSLAGGLLSGVRRQRKRPRRVYRK
jgi:putative membrane protein (TIGR04086 family)